MSGNRIQYKFYDIIAVIHPRPGKIERVTELLLNLAAVVKASEPEAYKFKINHEISGDAPHIVMTEVFKDKAAFDYHLETQAFKDLIKVWEEEDLLSEPMHVLHTKEVGGWVDL